MDFLNTFIKEKNNNTIYKDHMVHHYQSIKMLTFLLFVEEQEYFLS